MYQVQAAYGTVRAYTTRVAASGDVALAMARRSLLGSLRRRDPAIPPAEVAFTVTEVPEPEPEQPPEE